MLCPSGYLDNKNTRKPAGEAMRGYEQARARAIWCIQVGSDAVIRIIAGSAGPERQGHGMILISLTGEMPVKMRSIITLAFPHFFAVWTVFDPSVFSIYVIIINTNNYSTRGKEDEVKKCVDCC